MPTFYIAIRPPVDHSLRIANAMRQLGDPWPSPHITLRAPENLTSDLTWLSNLRRVAKATAPFAAAFGDARTFRDRVLYLSVDSTGIIELHERMLDALGPSSDLGSQSSAAKPYVPHLTLFVARRHRALPAFENVVSRLQDLEPFEVIELTVLRREDSATRYRTWKRVPLAVSRNG